MKNIPTYDHIGTEEEALNFSSSITEEEKRELSENIYVDPLTFEPFVIYKNIRFNIELYKG